MLLRVWMCLTHELGDECIKMLLVDEEGVKIEATVHVSDVPKFRFLTWCEGRWFQLKHARVVQATAYGSLTPHDFKLIFVEYTTFSRTYDNIPNGHFMEYPSIPDILDERVADEYPKDVLGVVTHVGKLQPYWVGPKLHFTIRDTSLRSLQCLIIGKAAEELLRKFWKDADRHLFVILRCLYIKHEFNVTWLRGHEPISAILYGQTDNADYNGLLNSFPNPVPARYSEEVDVSHFIF